MRDGNARHIVHVIAQLRFGAGRYVVDTALAQQRRHPGAVTVVVGDDGEDPWVSSSALLTELSVHGVEVLRCGDLFHRDARNLKASAERLRRAVGPWRTGSVVHAHTAMTALVARWAGSPTVVCSCHGWSLERPAAFDLQDAIAFSMCDAVTTPSAHWARVLTERAGLDHVPIVPYGFDLGRYPHATRTLASNRPLRIVCVGELTERKGPDVLLDAMTVLWKHHPDVELHFVGGGDRAEQVQAHARTIDPSGTRVVFHGQVTAPYGMLDMFDLFALASRSDNQPVAIVEAMLAGLPVVSTRVGGIAELIEGGQCGYVVEPNTPAPLADVLHRLIAAGAECRRAMGESGERFARRTFDVGRHVAALEDVYRCRRRTGQAA